MLRKNRNLSYLAANGVSYEITSATPLAWLRSGYSWFFAFLFVMIMSTYAPIEYIKTPLVPNVPITFWTLVFILYVALAIVFTTIVGAAFDFLGLSAVPLPLVGSLIVLSFLYIEKQWFNLVTWDSASGFPLEVTFFLFYFFLEQVLQVIFLTFVHPKALRPLRPTYIEIPSNGSEYPVKKVRREGIVIGGQRFALQNVQYISSVEHYVRVVDVDGDHFIRAKLSETIDQTDERDGILVHRSHWVCANGIAWAKRSSQKLLVVAKDGTEFSVARSRRKQVLSWLDDQKKDVFVL